MGKSHKAIKPFAYCLFASKWPFKWLLSYTELQKKEAEVQYREKNNQKTQQWEREMLSIQSLTFVPDTWALAAGDIISLQDELCFSNTPLFKLQHLSWRGRGEEESWHRNISLLHLQWQSPWVLAQNQNKKEEWEKFPRDYRSWLHRRKKPDLRSTF